MNDIPQLDVQMLQDKADRLTYEDIERVFFHDAEPQSYAYEIIDIARLDSLTPVWRIDVWATPVSPTTIKLLGKVGRVQVTYTLHLDAHGILRLSIWKSLKPTQETKA